jgi:two-component system, cell cycle response regulator DivK
MGLSHLDMIPHAGPVAGEPILIVDDTPVNLNLMRLLLTHEGYAVRTAARAEEAIDLLGSYRPSLILADIRLPGMDGLEMTRCIKTNPLTKAIKVIALTGFAKSGDPERAAGAGCDEYLTRPIESHVLASRIRAVLDRPAPCSNDHRLVAASEPAVAPLPGGEEVEDLRREFLSEGEAKSRHMLDSLDSGFDAEASARELHSWIGSAGLLGHPEIAKMARAGEEMLRQGSYRVEDVRECLSSLLLTFSELRSADEFKAPEEVGAALRGKRVALIGFTAESADSMCGVLAKAGARPRLFEAEDGPEYHPVQECDLVIVHVRAGTVKSRWLDGAAALPTGMRLVLAGDRRDLLKLPVATLAREAEVLAEPWHADEVLMRLNMALNRRVSASPDATHSIAAANAGSLAAPADAPGSETPLVATPAAPVRPKVVLADDDAIVLTVVASTLQNYGMSCETANNGKDAYRLILETRPHVAVLDVNMPGQDGFEVLAAVREANLPVSVILLTARQREGDILRGFQLGADDYLVKPFNPLELMARLKRLLKR